MIRSLYIFVIILSLNAHADVQVAFFEAYNSQGENIQFEEGGRFVRVAISTDTGWLHVHPYRGVEVVQKLKDVQLSGLYPTEILNLKTDRPLQISSLQSVLDLSFDPTFSWSSKTSTYCSKLVGQLLNISPQVMLFAGKFWKGQKNLRVGELGLSPDDIYKSLKKKKAILCGRVAAGA